MPDINRSVAKYRRGAKGTRPWVDCPMAFAASCAHCPGAVRFFQHL